MKHIKSQSTWDKAMEYEGLTVIDFYMSYCTPCQKIKPYIEELSAEYASKGEQVRFFTIEIDDVPAMSRKYKVASVPAVFFFVSGEESGKRIIGYKPKDVFAERVDAELAKLKKKK